jgi:hypothetical protein
LLYEEVWKYNKLRISKVILHGTHRVAFFALDCSSGAFIKVNNLNFIPSLGWWCLFLLVEHTIWRSAELTINDIVVGLEKTPRGSRILGDQR